MQKIMTAKQYQRISSELLGRHFGLEINDLDLAEDGVIKELINQSVQPFEAINRLADKFDLERFDGKIAMPLVLSDQDFAQKKLIENKFGSTDLFL